MPNHLTNKPWGKATFLLSLLLPLALLLAAMTLRRLPPSWEKLSEQLRTRYPEVRQISVPELAAWLADPERPQPLLLDVRQEEEFRISHLPGAVRVEPRSTHPRLPEETTPETPIVAYCSVGQRSSAIASRLTALGYTNVTNLEGSIFAWANAGHPVVRNGDEVHEVHPYNARWGRLLRKDLRAEVPGR